VGVWKQGVESICTIEKGRIMRLKKIRSLGAYIMQRSTRVKGRILTTLRETARENYKKCLYFNCYVKIIMTCTVCEISQI